MSKMTKTNPCAQIPASSVNISKLSFVQNSVFYLGDVIYTFNVEFLNQYSPLGGYKLSFRGAPGSFPLWASPDGSSWAMNFWSAGKALVASYDCDEDREMMLQLNVNYTLVITPVCSINGLTGNYIFGPDSQGIPVILKP